MKGDIPQAALRLLTRMPVRTHCREFLSNYENRLAYYRRYHRKKKSKK